MLTRIPLQAIKRVARSLPSFLSKLRTRKKPVRSRQCMYLIPFSRFFCRTINTDIKSHRAGARFTKAKEAKVASGEKDAQNGVDFGVDFTKDDMSFLDENETTISVSYAGGGQDLKEGKSGSEFCSQGTQLTIWLQLRRTGLLRLCAKLRCNSLNSSPKPQCGPMPS